MTAVAQAVHRGIPRFLRSAVEKRFVIVSLLFSMCVIAVYFLVWRDKLLLSPDSEGYIEYGGQLLRGQLPDLKWRTPGFPLFLILTHSIPTPGDFYLLVSLCLHFLSVAFLAGFLLRSGVPRTGVAIFAIIASTPPYVEAAAMVLTENLTEFLFTAIILLLVSDVRSPRWWKAAAAGVLIASTAFIRPSNQLLAPALGGLLVALPLLHPVRRRKLAPMLRHAVLVAGISAVLIGALAMKNYVREGYFGISSLGGYALCLKTVKVIERLPDEHAVVRDIMIRTRDKYLVKPGSSHTGYAYANQLMGILPPVTGMSHLQLSRYLTTLNLYLIRTAPLTFLWEVRLGYSGFWHPNTEYLANMNSRALHMLWSAMQALQGLLFWCAAGFLASIGVVTRLRKLRADRRHPQWTVTTLRCAFFALSGMLIFYTVTVVAFFATPDARYRRPVELMILATIVLGATVLRDIRSTGRTETQP